MLYIVTIFSSTAHTTEAAFSRNTHS